MLGDRIQKSVVISAVGHVGVLAFAVVSFAVKPLAGVPPESLPVEIISDAQFSQVMAGERNAKQTPTPKPRVEKIADPTPPSDNPAQKISDKQEIKVASAEEPPPMPQQRPDPKPDPKPTEAKPEKAETKPEKAEPKKTEAKPEPKTDPIAEALKKEEAKKAADKKAAEKKAAEKKAAEAKAAAKKPDKPQPKFDPKMVAALLDKRDAQRHADTGQVINTTASLGLSNASAKTLSQSALDALRAQIQACWDVPVGATDDPNLLVRIKMQLNRDGSLSGEPVIANRLGGTLFQITAESALRAVRKCQPFKLPPAEYEAWKDLDVTFDPRDFMRG